MANLLKVRSEGHRAGTSSLSACKSAPRFQLQDRDAKQNGLFVDLNTILCAGANQSDIFNK